MPEARSRSAARSRARSVVEAYRCSGSFERHRSTIQTSWAGVLGATVASASGSDSMIAESVCAGVERSKARPPMTISYRIEPKEN